MTTLNQAAPSAAGRNWSYADSITLVTFNDCARVDFKWNDGAYIYTMFDNKEQAIADLNRMGCGA